MSPSPTASSPESASGGCSSCQVLNVGELSKVYGFTDVDGTQPPVFRTGDLEKAYAATGSEHR